jgi:hypothetical protein
LVDSTISNLEGDDRRLAGAVAATGTDFVIDLVALGQSGRPQPAAIGNTPDMLGRARDWMRYFAFEDAHVPAGPTPLIDASKGLGTVDTMAKVVGKSRVKEFHHLATTAGKYAVVFAVNGFTNGAVRWADEHAVALFEIGEDGMVRAVGAVAKRLLNGSDARHGA